MMLTIHGLPTSTNYQELKRIIKQECNITDFILDSLVMDDDGCKKVRIGVTDDGDGSHLMKYLNGYRYAGHILRIVPVGKPNQQNQGNFGARGSNYQPRNDYQPNNNNFGGRAMHEGPPRANWGSSGQWGQNMPPPVQQNPFPNQPIQPVATNSFPHQPQPRGFAPNVVPPVQQNFGYPAKSNVPDHPVTIMKDNFQGPSQFHHQPAASGHFQSQPHGQQAHWPSQAPAKPQTFDKPAASGYGQMGFNDSRPGPKHGPEGGYKEYDKGDRRFPPQRDASPPRRRASPPRRMSPGRRVSPGRRMSPARPGGSNRAMPSPQARAMSPGPYRRGSPGPHRDRASPQPGPSRRLSPGRRDTPPSTRRMSPGRRSPSPRRRSPPMEPPAGMRGFSEDNEEIVEEHEKIADVWGYKQEEEDSEDTNEVMEEEDIDDMENIDEDIEDIDEDMEEHTGNIEENVPSNKKGLKKCNPLENPKFKKLFKYLSKEGRKRCRILIAGNVAPGRAVKMAQKRWKHLASVMPQGKLRRLIWILKNEKMKRNNNIMHNPSEVEYIGNFVRVIEIKQSSEVRIQHMLKEQVKILLQYLMSKIMQLPNGKGPGFAYYVYDNGVLTVSCRDKQSQLWLHSEANHIEPWPGANLSASIVRVPPIPKRVYVVIPSSETIDVAQALTMLKVQNRGLNTEDWVVISTKPVARGILVALSIDERSANALKEARFKACMGLKTIYFQVGRPHY